MQCVKWKISSTIQYKINAQGSRKQCEGSFGLRPNPQPPPPKSSDCATAFLEPVPGEMGIAGGGYSGGVDTTEGPVTAQTVRAASRVAWAARHARWRCSVLAVWGRWRHVVAVAAAWH